MATPRDERAVACLLEQRPMLGARLGCVALSLGRLRRTLALRLIVDAVVSQRRLRRRLLLLRHVDTPPIERRL
eukprot:1409546-Prymnesium_polylepis.1